MTLPTHPGTISMDQVNTELGYSSTASISLNDAAVRTLFGIPSGTISLDDGHGKASYTHNLTSVHYNNEYVDMYGFEAPEIYNFGTISPSIAAGYTIKVLSIYYPGHYGTYDLNFSLLGNLAQNTFTSVTISGVTYNSSAAFWSVMDILGTLYTVWEWGVSSNILPVGTHYVTII